MPTLDLSVRPRALSLSAPAKINLTLAVSDPREDGYHELRSLVVGVDLRDAVTCAVGADVGVGLECDDTAIKPGTNLAWIAAKLLAGRYGLDGRVRIALRKRIPLGAGLGGGSSDAAAAFRLCNELWSLGLNDNVLAEIGAEVGSDVPLFFSLPSAVITGRGERVERMALRWTGWALLVLPKVSISTRDVYACRRSADAAGDDVELTTLGRCTSARELSPLLFNDLEPAVFRACPELKNLRDVIQARVGGVVRVTGSGSTLFQLFDDYERAATTARTIEQSCPGVATCVVRAPVSCGDPVSEEL